MDALSRFGIVHFRLFTLRYIRLGHVARLQFTHKEVVKHMKTRISIVAAVLVLAACGGGGDAAPAAGAPVVTTASAAGIWTGTTSTNRSLTGVVLGDGTFYVLYSVVGSPSIIAGVVQGNGTLSGSAFSSSNAKDFNLEGAGILSATLSATVSAKQTFNGTLSNSIGPTTFTSTYDPTSEAVASLNTVQGTYTGSVVISAGVESATVTVASTGAISGKGASGCAVSGKLTSRTDVNAYDISVSFGPSPCYFANQTFTGVAAYDADDKRLYAAAPNAGRTDGILFVATKP